MVNTGNKIECGSKEIKSESHGKESETVINKDVELFLEVEMDDEVKEIIASPDKCTSTLLDVTVIKPKDLNQAYTTQRQVLNKDEVRKLIATMELEKQDKKRLIDQIISVNESALKIHKSHNPKSAGDYLKNKIVQHGEKKKISNCLKRDVMSYVNRDNVYFNPIHKMCATDDTSSEIGTEQNRKAFKKGEGEKVQQIYTTQRTYNDIKSIFTCKNKKPYQDFEKLNKPCLCQNCAILGVLTDTQKKPFVTENLYDPREFTFNDKLEFKPRKKSTSFKEEHTECQFYFKHLSSKIKDLEDRLAQQEEKAVPRDYFKRIITKLVGHITKITSYASQERLVKEAQRYKSSYKDSYKSYRDYKDKEMKDYKDKYRGKWHDNCDYYSSCQVRPVLIDNTKPSKMGEKVHIKDSSPKTSSFVSSQPGHQQTCESFWKWGGEILKPGIDLKNKIIVLLEETLHNLKWAKEKQTKEDADIKTFVNEFSDNLYRTVNEIPEKDLAHDRSSKAYQKSRPPTNSFQSISDSSIFKAKDSTPSNQEKKYKRSFLPRFLSKRNLIQEEPLNVSYMNPKVSNWLEESQVSFKVESSDVDSIKQNAHEEVTITNAGPESGKVDLVKAEFVKTLANTKEADKLKLWQSVWNEAVSNGQTRSDRVTIQIPDKSGGKPGKTTEIRYTIGELESLLTGKPVKFNETGVNAKKNGR